MRRARRVSSIAVTAAFVAAGLILLPPANTALPQSISVATAKAGAPDVLFDRLKVATDEYEAGKIEKEILELWDQSDRPEIDELFSQAGVLIAGMKVSSALQVLDEIIQREPNWAEGWNARATVHYLLGAFDRSLADTERAVTLEPRHFHALRTMGACHVRKGRYREALAAYRKALAIHPFLNDRLDVIPELEKTLGDPRR